VNVNPETVCFLCIAAIAARIRSPSKYERLPRRANSTWTVDRQHVSSNGRILIVEDGPSVREMLAEHLSTRGYEVARADRGSSPYEASSPHATTCVGSALHVGDDGRRLRRYARRWIFERFFAWLQWKCRLLVRLEYYASNFLDFVRVASIMMLLKQF
jgi:hypothetical protein